MDRSAKIVVALLVIAVIGFFIYSKLAGWHKKKVESAVTQEQAEWQNKTDQLEQKITSLQTELAEVKNQKLPTEKMAEVFGGEQKTPQIQDDEVKLAEVVVEVKKLAAVVRDEKKLAALLNDEKKLAEALGDETKLIEVMREEEKLAKVLRDEKKLAVILRDEKKLAEILAEENKDETQEDETQEKVIVKKKISPPDVQSDLADIERRIRAFFTYLDEQAYVQAYDLEGGTYLQYQIAINKLSSTPPVIAGEMQSLYAMVRNVAHFYRVMGKKPIYLSREILQNEAEVIEPVMRTFYRWYTMDEAGKSALGGRPSPEIMYEYAGFLLHTLGGRSYLLRRSPKVRALTTYYCVLTLDRANDEELNSMGIDIRPYIKSSLMEIKNQIGLIYQKEYITKLSELSLKYYP
ncbi:MAG: hypothetical protein JSW26_24310 [Desulfobacterales bacterium]|nr:MAG: hypothetical protein JSW26_24310 [Desulfobacterales bacterium]